MDIRSSTIAYLLRVFRGYFPVDVAISVFSGGRSQRETIYPQWNLECTMRCRRRRPLSLCDSPETEEDAVIFSDSGAQATVDNASSRRAPSRPRPPAASPHAQSRTRALCPNVRERLRRRIRRFSPFMPHGINRALDRSMMIAAAASR